MSAAHPSIRPWTEADRELFRDLVTHPSLAAHFDKFQGPHGLEHKLADPKLARDCVRLAFVDGAPAGFSLAWRLEAPSGGWAMTRVGVLAPYRGRGIGTALAMAVRDAVLEPVPAARTIDVAASAWMPEPAADRIAARLGYAHERWFWLMQRPRGARPEPVWPAGITTRPFDGSEQMFADWMAVYNDSFAQHYRFVPSSVADARAIAAGPGFRPDGLRIAWRDGRLAGFCGCVLHGSRGEIAVLGTAHDARGIGLGRALLRWGVGWLEEQGPDPVTLLVDGQNEGALSLYRSEGFEIARTRRIWTRALPGRA